MQEENQPADVDDDFPPIPTGDVQAYLPHIGYVQIHITTPEEKEEQTRALADNRNRIITRLRAYKNGNS